MGEELLLTLIEEHELLLTLIDPEVLDYAETKDKNRES